MPAWRRHICTFQWKQLQLTGLPEATRAACLTSCATFGETFYPRWRAGRFHELLALKLEDCLRRKIKRLIINVPPQHGKSRLASIIFAAWAMTKYPCLRIPQAGHTGDLSRGFIILGDAPQPTASLNILRRSQEMGRQITRINGIRPTDVLIASIEGVR